MRLLGLLIVLLVLGAGYLYLQPDAARELRNKLPSAGLSQKPDRLYKWRNPAGAWQITDTPPPPGVDYQRLEYRGDENVLPVPPGIQERE